MQVVIDTNIIIAKATKSRLVIGYIKHYPIEEMRTMIWELQ